MEKVYLVFAYEPFSRSMNRNHPQHFTKLEELKDYINKLARRRELHYIDVYIVEQESTSVLQTDNHSSQKAIFQALDNAA